MTVLTGLPSRDGLHGLDVYVENEEGLWNHAYYEFTTNNPDDPAPTSTGTSTTSDTNTTPSFLGNELLLIAGIAGVCAVVIVVAVFVKVKKS